MPSLDVEVTLENIHCYDPNGDEINGQWDLEVRGTLDVCVGTGEPFRVHHTLFRQIDNDSVQILAAEVHIIQRSRIVSVFPDEVLRIGGHLKEDDDLSADDDFGKRYEYFNYSSLLNMDARTSIAYTTQGQWVNVRWWLRKVREWS